MDIIWCTGKINYWLRKGVCFFNSLLKVSCPWVFIPICHCDLLFLLLIKRYNLYKALACSTAFFQLSLFCAIFFQLCTFLFLISSKTSFSQCVLGLPIGLLDMGFHLLIAIVISWPLCSLSSTLILLTWRIWWAPNNASKWQMGFNLACKWLIVP